MKIILAHKYWYRRAGAERYVFDLKDLLETNGHEVIPFAMRNALNEPASYDRCFGSEIDFEHPRVFREKFCAFCRMVYSLEAKRKFRALVREVRPDFVHINNIYHHISPSILDVCRDERIPVIQTVHDYKLICPNYKLFCSGAPEAYCKGGRYFKEVFHRCTAGSLLGSLATAIEMFVHHRILKIYERSVSAWIAPSHFVKEKLVEYGLPQEKIHMLHHVAVNYETHSSDISGGQIRFNRARKDLTPQDALGGFRNSQQERQSILYVGRLAPEKGVDVLIRAMQIVPDTHLTIVGKGPEESRLKSLVHEIHLEERVTFAGRRSAADRDRLLANVSLAVVPSLWYEVFGYAVIEAWVAGVPVVASRIGALPELVGALHPQCLFEPGDWKKLGQILGTLLLEPEKIQKMGEEARQHARTAFSPIQYYQSYSALAESILKK